VRPYIVATYAFVNPLVAIVIAAIAGDEHMGTRGFVAAFLICAAVAVSLVRFPRRDDATPVESPAAPPEAS
jgi:drug/metabolite transporter (DMT)-like permease